MIIDILSSGCGLLEFLTFIEGLSFFLPTKNETVPALGLKGPLSESPRTQVNKLVNKTSARIK